MGLDTSHGAFNGSYGAFHRWRKAITEAAGGEFSSVDEHSGMAEWWLPLDKDDIPGLYKLLSHDDSEGEIAPDLCERIAAELRHYVLPNITLEIERKYGGGHIGGYDPVRGWYGGVERTTRRFIDGCLRAYRDGDELVFS